jgi:hypothetical protein
MWALFIPLLKNTELEVACGCSGLLMSFNSTMNTSLLFVIFTSLGLQLSLAVFELLEVGAQPKQNVMETG